MQFSFIRSGLTEKRDEAIVVACDSSGTILHESGDVSMPMYYRSTIKPLQAEACLEAGLDLPDEHLALVCASHGGYPAHLAIVRKILTDAGLDETALRCTPDWPFTAAARHLMIARGHRKPRPLFHNCSGKHAGMLAACVAAGWPTDGYLELEHPLQVRSAEIITETTGVESTPAGVDGCGAPAFRGNLVGLATAFAKISVEPRFAQVPRAMARFPALVADNVRPDGRLGLWWGGPAKVGAAGVMALGRSGIGIATKSVPGSATVAVAAVITAASQLGMLTMAMSNALEDEAAPPVLGGGHRVGTLVGTET